MTGGTGVIEARVRPPEATAITTRTATPTPDVAPRQPRARTAGLVSRCRPLVRPAAYYVVSRAVVLAATAVVVARHPTVRLTQALGTLFDGRWYLLIAQHGYPHHLVNEGDGSRWGFFPGFPLVVRGVAEITRLSLPDAALAAAFVFGLTSAVAIFLAVREVAGTELANRAVLLYVCFPTSYVLSLAYTEGLFITAAALCLFALSRRAFVTAALCACLAGFTRNAGVVVVVVVLVVALPAAWRERSWRPALAAALAPVGLVAFMAYSQIMVGTPFAFLSAQKFWGSHFVWFRAPVAALVGAVQTGPGGHGFGPDALASAALVLGFLGLWWLDRMRTRPRPADTFSATPAGAATTIAVPATWWIYTFGALLVAYSAFFLDSIPRYTMAAFPLFLAFAWRLPRRWTVPVAGVLLCAQVALLVTVLSPLWHPVASPLVP